MDMDDNLKRLMKELGTAINESLSDSEPIAQAISNIKGAGYNVFLVLEATIGFNRRNEDDEQAEPGDDGEAIDIRSGELDLTPQDTKFLRSLKISFEDESEIG
jgi:hypothetical protein